MARVLIGLAICLYAGGARAAFEDLPRASLATAVGRDYVAIRDLTLELARAYPPARHYFVNVSQVSTPVIAMVRAIYGPNAARNLPLAYLKHLKPPGLPIRCRFTDKLRAPDQRYRDLREKLYTPDVIAHFRAELIRALPAADELGGRALVFVEWVNEGFTISNLARELSAFQRDAPERCPHPYTLFGLTHGRGLVREILRELGAPGRVLSGRALKIFDQRLYRDFAEYGPFEPGVEGPRARPVFDDLVAIYRDRVRRDPVVRAARGQTVFGCDRVLTGAQRGLAHLRRALAL